MTTTSCKHCGAAIAASDVDAELGFARCSYCGGITSIQPAPAAAKPKPAGGRAEEAREPRPFVPMPDGLEVMRRGGRLSIVRRWFSPLFIALLLFTVVWDGFLFFWFFGVSATGAPLVFSLFPLIHVVVGVGLTYYTICGFVNQTEIAADGSRLRIRHGPLPWPGSRDLDPGSLRQVYVKEKVYHSKNGSSTRYALYAVNRAGRETKLVGGLPDAAQGLFIEAELEEHLGIDDREVRGSYR